VPPRDHVFESGARHVGQDDAEWTKAGETDARQRVGEVGFTRVAVTHEDHETVGVRGDDLEAHRLGERGGLDDERLEVGEDCGRRLLQVRLDRALGDGSGRPSRGDYAECIAVGCVDGVAQLERAAQYGGEPAVFLPRRRSVVGVCRLGMLRGRHDARVEKQHGAARRRHSLRDGVPVIAEQLAFARGVANAGGHENQESRDLSRIRLFDRQLGFAQQGVVPLLPIRVG
jgi:hypothetical protein